MKKLNPKFNRKDPLNPIIGSKAKDNDFKSLTNNKKTYDLGSSNQNSSFFKTTLNNSTNRIISHRQISSISDIMTENKKTSHSNNNITLSSDNIFACLNNGKNNNRKQRSVSMPRKKKVRFLDNEKFVQIILVESHKKFHKIDDIFDGDQKDIDKIKVLKGENKKKDNNTINDNNVNPKTKDVSPIKAKEEKIKEKKKETCNNNNNKNSKPYDDKACKCSIF